VLVAQDPGNAENLLCPDNAPHSDQISFIGLLQNSFVLAEFLHFVIDEIFLTVEVCEINELRLLWEIFLSLYLLE
jgi:hypothetical protein